MQYAAIPQTRMSQQIRMQEKTDAIDPADSDAGKPQTVMQESRRQFSSNLANNLYTEMTTEMTAKMKTEMTTEKKEKDVFSFSPDSQVLENQENSALREEVNSEPKQEIEESCAAPPEIIAIALLEKKIKKARPKKPRDEVLESKREAFKPFVVVFNQDAPAAWEKSEDLVEVLDKIAIGRLNTFTKKYGDRSLEIFQKGFLYAHTDKFYRDKVDWTLGQYLSNDKPNEFAEKYDRLQAKNQTPFGEEPSNRPMTPTRLKMAKDYDMIGRALEKAGHMKLENMGVAS